MSSRLYRPYAWALLILLSGSASSLEAAPRLDESLVHWVTAETARQAKLVCKKTGAEGGCPNTHPVACGALCRKSGSCTAPESDPVGPRFLLTNYLRIWPPMSGEGSVTGGFGATQSEIEAQLRAAMQSRLRHYLRLRGYPAAAAQDIERAVFADASLRMASRSSLVHAPVFGGTDGARRPSCDSVTGPRHMVTLKSAHGQFLVAEKGGQLNANRTEADVWEHFELIEHSDGRVSLRSHHGKYVVADRQKKAKVDRSELNDWEKFQIILHPDGRVSLKSFHDTYLTADKTGKVVASRKAVSDWEKFTITPVPSS